MTRVFVINTRVRSIRVSVRYAYDTRVIRVSYVKIYGSGTASAHSSYQIKARHNSLKFCIYLKYSSLMPSYTLYTSTQKVHVIFIKQGNTTDHWMSTQICTTICTHEYMSIEHFRTYDIRHKTKNLRSNLIRFVVSYSPPQPTSTIATST